MITPKYKTKHYAFALKLTDIGHPGTIEIKNISSIVSRYTMEILDTEKKQNEFAARVV